MAEKYLWRYVEPAEPLAERLKTAATLETRELQPLALEAADRLAKQTKQIEGIINVLLPQIGPEKTIKLLIQAGIDRHELVSCWDVPPEMAIQGEIQSNSRRQDIDF